MYANKDSSPSNIDVNVWAFVQYMQYLKLLRQVLDTTNVLRVTWLYVQCRYSFFFYFLSSSCHIEHTLVIDVNVRRFINDLSLETFHTITYIRYYMQMDTSIHFWTLRTVQCGPHSYDSGMRHSHWPGEVLKKKTKNKMKKETVKTLRVRQRNKKQCIVCSFDGNFSYSRTFICMSILTISHKGRYIWNDVLVCLHVS